MCFTISLVAFGSYTVYTGLSNGPQCQEQSM